MGCLSMRFIRSAMTEEEAGIRYGAPLNALASAIAAGLARGWDLEKAVRQARLLLLGSLARNRRSRWGTGAGPALF